MADPPETRAGLHELIDSLEEYQLKAAEAALKRLRANQVYTALSSIPGVELPAVWPPQFQDLEPMAWAGDELPSEELIRFRR
jgi:hypothetical protein